MSCLKKTVRQATLVFPVKCVSHLSSWTRVPPPRLSFHVFSLTPTCGVYFFWGGGLYIPEVFDLRCFRLFLGGVSRKC